MASNRYSANDAEDEAGRNKLSLVWPTSSVSDSRAANGRVGNAATIPVFQAHPDDSFPLNLCMSRTGIVIQISICKYVKLSTSLFQLETAIAILPDRQDVVSQRILYTFLLTAGPGDWENPVQIYNHLFHKTSDLITYDGHLVTPAPSTPALATEASIKAMMEEQDLYPIDKEGVFKYMDELTTLPKPFIDRSRTSAGNAIRAR